MRTFPFTWKPTYYLRAFDNLNQSRIVPFLASSEINDFRLSINDFKTSVDSSTDSDAKTDAITYLELRWVTENRKCCFLTRLCSLSIRRLHLDYYQNKNSQTGRTFSNIVLFILHLKKYSSFVQAQRVLFLVNPAPGIPESLSCPLFSLLLP